MHVPERPILADAPAPASGQDARRFDGILLELASLERDDLVAAFTGVAVAAAEALGVARVALWQYDADRSAMTCTVAWERGQIVAEDAVIDRVRHGAYWDALHATRTLAVNCARTDPVLACMQDYVRTHDVGAKLSSSIRVRRGTFGTICAEHLGEARSWTALEEQFVASLADRLALDILLDTQRQLEAQLVQARKMEAVGTMASGVAHDFNNILNVVLTSVGSARALHARGADAAEDLQAIEGAVTRAASLTRTLSFLGRQETVGPAPVDVNDVVRGMAERTRTLVPPTVRLQLLPAPQPLTIHGDREFLGRALTTLAGVAVHAMRAEGGSLTIAARALHVPHVRSMHGITLAAGHWAHLRVLDTGEGFEPGVLPRLFDPFVKVAGGASHGLGLSVVYGGVRQHGGQIAVESVPRRGTVFHLFLPLAGDA